MCHTVNVSYNTFIMDHTYLDQRAASFRSTAIVGRMGGCYAVPLTRTWPMVCLFLPLAACLYHYNTPYNSSLLPM